MVSKREAGEIAVDNMQKYAALRPTQVGGGKISAWGSCRNMMPIFLEMPNQAIWFGVNDFKVAAIADIEKRMPLGSND